jgi:hypothetical protein
MCKIISHLFLQPADHPIKMQQSTREQGVLDNKRSVALPGLVSPDYEELFDTSIKCISNWMHRAWFSNAPFYYRHETSTPR